MTSIATCDAAGIVIRAIRNEMRSPVVIVPENAFPPIPAGHDMIESPWIFNANRTRHLGNI